MDIAGKISRLTTGFQVLEASVSMLNHSELFYKPEPGAWHIHEVLEHIFIVEFGTSRILRMNGKSTVYTGLEIVGEESISAYLANPAPIAAPESVIPKGRFASQEELMQKFRETRTTLVRDLEQGVIVFGNDTVKHPLLGDMTKRDWLNFTILHAERHLLQIEKLKAKALSAGM